MQQYCQSYDFATDTCSKGENCKRRHAKSYEDWFNAKFIICPHGSKLNCVSLEYFYCPYSHGDVIDKPVNELGFAIITKDKGVLSVKLRKTKMCNVLKEHNTDICPFAHSEEEQQPRYCLFGNDCRFFKMNHVCTAKHKSETLDMYLRRSRRQNFVCKRTHCAYEKYGGVCRYFKKIQCKYLHPCETIESYRKRSISDWGKRSDLIKRKYR